MCAFSAIFEFELLIVAHLFSLTTTNESLEEKCEELRKQIEELHREVEIERRKNERLQLEQRTKNDDAVTAPANTSSREPDVSIATNI